MTRTNGNKRTIKTIQMRFVRKIQAITTRDRIRNTIVTKGLVITLIEKVRKVKQLN